MPGIDRKNWQLGAGLTMAKPAIRVWISLSTQLAARWLGSIVKNHSYNIGWFAVKLQQIYLRSVWRFSNNVKQIRTLVSAIATIWLPLLVVCQRMPYRCCIEQAPPPVQLQKRSPLMPDFPDHCGAFSKKSSFCRQLRITVSSNPKFRCLARC